MTADDATDSPETTAAELAQTAEAPGGDRLFGARAIERGFVTQSQVLAALRIQERAKVFLGRYLFLGEILWIREQLDEPAFAALLREAPARPEPAEIEESSRSRFFGEFAVNLGYCTEEQILEALNAQRNARERGESPPLLGELLIGKGHLTADQVDVVVANLLLQAGDDLEEEVEEDDDSAIFAD